MITISGRDVLPDNDVAPSLYDIGYGLAGIRRFAGQTPKPWTVLQHVYACATFLRLKGFGASVQLHGALHDAGEAVTGDVVHQWKDYELKYRQDALDDRIWREAKVDAPSPIEKTFVKWADHAVLVAEARMVGTATQEASVKQWTGIDEVDAAALQAVLIEIGAHDKTQPELAGDFVVYIEKLKGEIAR